jgi:hypothetical protein
MYLLYLPINGSQYIFPYSHAVKSAKHRFYFFFVGFQELCVGNRTLVPKHPHEFLAQFDLIVFGLSALALQLSVRHGLCIYQV